MKNFPTTKSVKLLANEIIMPVIEHKNRNINRFGFLPKISDKPAKKKAPISPTLNIIFEKPA